MSIETRVVLFSRSFRSLIKKHADLAKTIKDLKDFRALRVAACYRHSGPTDLKRTRDVFSTARAMERGTRSHARVASEGPSPTVRGGGLDNRSAGACPPRSLECADASDGKGQAPRPTNYGTVKGTISISSVKNGSVLNLLSEISTFVSTFAIFTVTRVCSRGRSISTL